MNLTAEWIVINFIILFVCLLMAAFFSGVETAVIASNRLYLKKLGKKGNKKAKIISDIIKKPDQFLRVVLTGTNIAVILSSAISSSLAIYYWGDKGVSISVVVTTLIILIFCEIIPKTIAQNYADQISVKVANALKVASTILFPIDIVLSWVSNFIIRIFTGEKYIPLKLIYNKKDLKIFFEVGEKEGVLEKKEKSMIDKILNLDDIYVKDVMIPKKEVIAIKDEATMEEAIELMNKKGLSRIPVYRENLDNITGIIYAKDFLLNNSYRKLSEKINSLSIIHAPYYVLETKRLTNLLKEFQKKRTHIAVVVNKDKKNKGVVTIEDLLEEIFGEIEDEFDKNK
ncbi:MAG: hemolysin family protein [Candidatus Caldatribacteriota bacterium]|nr:hemolysin family protein [Candidatus Caldatribacteriota bacterium]